MSQCTFYIVRHAETAWNVQRRQQGHMDSSITVKGVEQCGKLKKRLASVNFVATYSSDLRRAQTTAQLLLGSGKSSINITSKLRERSFGQDEGLKKEYDSIFQGMADEEHFNFKFSKIYESDKELSRRLFKFLKTKEKKCDGKDVLLVTHGGIMKACLIALKYASYRQLASGAIGNCSYIKLQAIDGKFVVLNTYRIQLK